MLRASSAKGKPGRMFPLGRWVLTIVALAWGDTFGGAINRKVFQLLSPHPVLKPHSQYHCRFWGKTQKSRPEAVADRWRYCRRVARLMHEGEQGRKSGDLMMKFQDCDMLPGNWSDVGSTEINAFQASGARPMMPIRRQVRAHPRTIRHTARK